MIISPRTGKTLITQQDVQAVERFKSFLEAVTANCDEGISECSTAAQTHIYRLLTVMHADIDSRRQNRQPA